MQRGHATDSKSHRKLRSTWCSSSIWPALCSQTLPSFFPGFIFLSSAVITSPYIIYLPHLVYFLHVSLKCHLHANRAFYLFCSSLYSQCTDIFSDECHQSLLLTEYNQKSTEGPTPEVSPVLVTRPNWIQLRSSLQSKGNAKMILWKGTLLPAGKQITHWGSLPEQCIPEQRIGFLLTQGNDAETSRWASSWHV